jgi:hypothetical protein
VIDRLWDAFRRLVRVELAEVRWLGTYEYTVLSASENSVDLSAPSDVRLPGLSAVRSRADSVSRQVPKIGGKAHVVFVDGDLSRPVCTWTEPASSPDEGATARLAGGGQAIARQGDFVSSSLPIGTMILATITQAPPPPSPSPINPGPVVLVITAPVPSLPGTIITGRNEVKA